MFSLSNHEVRRPSARRIPPAVALCLLCVLCLPVLPLLAGCGAQSGPDAPTGTAPEQFDEVSDKVQQGGESADPGEPEAPAEPATPEPAAADAEELRAKLNIVEDFREGFVHGEKGSAYQKYIVLHDTEGDFSPESVVDYWDGNGNLVAAHFVVGKDGSIVQCAPLDTIIHHAGFGDTGHNELYGVEDESRDDMRGTTPIGDWAADYGMNSYSIGIEMVHVGGSGGYPEEQLTAVDALIAYIDAYYGFESEIIDHKAWRTGNSDTSPEFADYLANYQAHRAHTASE